MINLFILFLATICANRSILVHSFNSYDDIHLAFDGITKPDIYRKWIPPPIESTRDHNDGPLYVNVSIYMYNFATVDEITSEYSFHLFLDMEWFDPRLRFSITGENPYNETILEGGQYHIERIWYPSVFIPNNREPGSFDSNTKAANLVRINNHGYVWMRKRKLLRIYCNMDFHYYPFDQQNCDFHLESSISTVANMKLRWNSNIAFSKGDNFQTIGFDLKGYETKETDKTYSKLNSFSRVTLKFFLVRAWQHHLFLYYLPSGIIVIASWASFWLEITSPPARVSIGVTTMLALVTTFKSSKTLLPNISYWNALDIWNMICIVFIFGSLVEFAHVNYVFNTEKRKKRNKKLKRKRENTILMAAHAREQNSKPRMSCVGSSLDTIYQNSVSGFSDLSMKLSTDFSDRESLSTYLSTDTRRRSSATLLVPEADKNFTKRRFNKEESGATQSRRSSRVNIPAAVIETTYFNLTPEEFANKIDRFSRIVFPVSFLIFNLLYWTILQVRIID